MGFYWSYTRSYSIRPFLCALDHQSNCIPVGYGLYTQFTGPFPCFVKVLGLACETGHTLQARTSRFFIGFGTVFHVSTFFPLDVTRHQHTWRALPCRSYHCICNQILATVKVWKWGYVRRIMGQYVNLVQSNYQALICSEIKLSSSWWENISQLWLATVTLGEPLTHNFIV